MPETITCPSGLTGEIRGLKVKELNILANRRLARGGEQIDRILASCWLSTQDPGPYAIGDRGLDWAQVLQGDRFFALLRIRMLSLGVDYAFAVACKSETCLQRFEWELSLDDLPVRMLPDDSRQRFQAGNRFEAWLPSAQTRVWFRLATGADEKRFARIRQASPDSIWSASLALRVLEVEGVADSQKRRFLEELELADAEFLRNEFERVDGGVETSIEVECPECLMTQDIDLPFDHRFFLASSRRKRTATSSAGSSTT
jgi:hypothetical protein